MIPELIPVRPQHARGNFTLEAEILKLRRIESADDGSPGRAFEYSLGREPQILLRGKNQAPEGDRHLESHRSVAPPGLGKVVRIDSRDLRPGLYSDAPNARIVPLQKRHTRPSAATDIAIASVSGMSSWQANFTAFMANR